MPDRLAELERRLNDPIGYATRRRASAGMPTEEYDELLGDLTNAPLSALAWLGRTLDKPGRAVRGLLAGKPEELANLIPFSDTLGITDSEGLLGGSMAQVTDTEDAVYGRDLLRQYGLAGEEDNWGNFLGGLGVEIATDPLTYLTLGTGTALTKGGQLASKAGVLPGRAVERLGGTLAKTLPHLDEASRIAMEGGDAASDVLGMLAKTDDPLDKVLTAARGSGLSPDDLLRMKDDPLAAVAKFGFGENAVKFGMGEAGIPVGKALDKISDVWGASAPGRFTAKMFDKASGNRDTLMGQEASRVKTETFRGTAADAAARAGTIVDELGHSEIPDEVMNDIGLYVSEKLWPSNKLTIGEREAMAASQGKSLRELSFEQTLIERGHDPTKFNYQKAAAAMDAEEAASFAQRQNAYEWGIVTTKGLDDPYATYTHRQLDVEKPTTVGAGKAFPTSGPESIHRVESLTGVRGGTGLLQDLADDVPLKDLLKQVEPYDLTKEATARQMERLADAGVDTKGLTQWQAHSMVAQLERGTPPEQLTRVLTPPTRAPHVPRETIDYVMAKLDTTADGSAVTKYRELDALMRSSKTLEKTLLSMPPDAPIPEAIYRALLEAEVPFTRAEVDSLLARGGWKRIAEEVDQLPEGAVAALRTELGEIPQVGQTVKALDRDNFGKVVALNGDTATVHFVSRQGAEATVELPVTSLRPATIIENIPEVEREMYQALHEQFKQSEKIARWLATNPGQWSKNIVENNLKADLSTARQVAGMDAIGRTVGRVVEALPPDPAQAQVLLDAMRAPPVTGTDPLAHAVEALFRHKKPVPDGKVRLVDAVSEMGLPTELAARARTITKLAEHLAKSGKIAPEVAQAIKSGDGTALIALDNLVIPAEVAMDLKGFVGGLDLNKNLGPLVKTFDTITNTLKTHLTSIFPAFTARNFLSTIWQDGVAGGFASPADMARAWKDSYHLLSKGEIQGASKFPMFAGKNLSDAEATRQLSILSYAHGVSPRMGTEAADVVGQGLPDAAIREGLPAKSFPGRDPLKGYVPTGPASYNPLAVRGGLSWETLGREMPQGNLAKAIPQTNEASQFLLAKGGEQLNAFTESLARNATFLRKLKQGFSPDQAAMMSKAAHVDYSEMTVFEREVMKRMMPFYAYSRHAVPYNLKEIARQPGGIVAQGIRGTVPDDEGFTPEQAVGAIPVGQEKDGTQRYLNLDLPFGVLNNVAGGGRGIMGTISQTGYRHLSMLNPLFKAPLEAITGQSFFQRGRPLNDLYSRTGAGTLGDAVLMNSPASRYITTGSMLTDPRKDVGTKALNLLGGVRMSDVNIEQSRERAAAKAATELLKEGGGRSFESLYFPESYQPSPQEAQLLQLLQTQAKRRRERLQ